MLESSKKKITKVVPETRYPQILTSTSSSITTSKNNFPPILLSGNQRTVYKNRKLTFLIYYKSYISRGDNNLKSS